MAGAWGEAATGRRWGQQAPGEPPSGVAKCSLSASAVSKGRARAGGQRRQHLPRLGSTRHRHQGVRGTPWCRVRRRPARPASAPACPQGPPRSEPRGPGGGGDALASSRPHPSPPPPRPPPAPSPFFMFSLLRPCIIASPVSDLRPENLFTPGTSHPSERMAQSNINGPGNSFFLSTWLFSDFFYFKQLYWTGPTGGAAKCIRAPLSCLWVKEASKGQNMKAPLENRNKLRKLCARQRVACGCTFH